MILDLVKLDQLLKEAAYEGSDDPQQNCAQDPDRVPARHEQPGDETYYEADDDQKDDECQHAMQLPGFARIMHGERSGVLGWLIGHGSSPARLACGRGWRLARAWR